MIRAAIVMAIIASSTFAPGARAQSQGDPQIDYMLQCQGCHLEDGRGSASAGVPSIVGLAKRFLEVPGGRTFLVQVPGVMQAPLDDGAVAALMNWMLMRYPGSEAAPAFTLYTKQEITNLRSKTPIDVAATRARLIATGASESN